jgi:hypothetical protein
MALSKIEGRRCPHPSSLRRPGLYDSLPGISGVLYLSVFEQPASRVFFSILPVNGWSAIFDELVKKSEIASNVIPADPGSGPGQPSESRAMGPLKQKKHPEPNPGMLSCAAFSRKTTRSVSWLFAKKIRRRGSIRTAIARVYETDTLHGWIMSVKSLGYGNHPLFSPLSKGHLR